MVFEENIAAASGKDPMEPHLKQSVIGFSSLGFHSEHPNQDTSPHSFFLSPLHRLSKKTKKESHRLLWVCAESLSGI